MQKPHSNGNEMESISNNNAESDTNKHVPTDSVFYLPNILFRRRVPADIYRAQQFLCIFLLLNDIWMEINQKCMPLNSTTSRCGNFEWSILSINFEYITNKFRMNSICQMIQIFCRKRLITGIRGEEAILCLIFRIQNEWIGI